MKYNGKITWHHMKTVELKLVPYPLRVSTLFFIDLFVATILFNATALGALGMGRT